MTPCTGTSAEQLCINEIENETKNSKSRTETLSNELIIRKSSLKTLEGNTSVGNYSHYMERKSDDDAVVYIY